MLRSFIKNVKECKECSVLFIKNGKERENVAFFWKERKRKQERCILLKRMFAQPCHPHSPRPARRGVYICGLWVLPGHTTARANMLTQIVLNSSSLYTLFYSVIYNSVHSVYRCLCSSRNRLGFYADIQKYFWDSVRALQ